MKKKIQNLTMKGLHSLAKDLEIPKYSSFTAKNRGNLESLIQKHPKAKDVDFSKYKSFAPKEEAPANSKEKKSDAKKPAVKRPSGIPITPRRSRSSRRR